MEATHHSCEPINLVCIDILRTCKDKLLCYVKSMKIKTRLQCFFQAENTLQMNLFERVPLTKGAEMSVHEQTTLALSRAGIRHRPLFGSCPYC